MTDASDLGRALAARRRRTTAVCEVCGAAFETWARKTQQARTCSPKCRQKRWRRSGKPDGSLAVPGDGTRTRIAPRLRRLLDP